MLQEEVGPEMRMWAGRRRHWWIQDGAMALTTDVVLSFLGKRFCSRVINWSSEINWQPCSPDLNPLDFSCCSFATIHVYCQSHKALTSWKRSWKALLWPWPSKWSKTQWQISGSVVGRVIWQMEVTLKLSWRSCKNCTSQGFKRYV